MVRNPSPIISGVRSRYVFMSGILCAFVLAWGACASSLAQITINTKTGEVTNTSSGTTTSTVDRKFAQIKPTNVSLNKDALDAKTRIELVRILEAEQGFAMRPFPRGHKGLTLAANGELAPYGEAYLSMVTSEGLAAKPGDRVVLSNVKIAHDRIIFDLNGGPDQKHRFLRHIQLGTGQVMNPVAQDDGSEPTGARLTLVFHDHIPEVTGSDVKALLAPLISFDVKTPMQAYTDTLPVKLKDAILNHQVLVGMDTDMVLYAKGPPENKTREMDGQSRFEEWIYGKPPQAVEFVRFHGNRVVRFEVAKVGETPEIFTKDEVSALLRTDGESIYASDAISTHPVKLGDVQRDPDKQASAPPPTLRRPGENPPDQTRNPSDVMRPVQFPKPKDGPPAQQPANQAPADTSQPLPPTTGDSSPQLQP